MTQASVYIFDGPGQPLRYEQWPLPAALRPGELLVAIEQATICGSDLHTIRGTRTEPTPAVLGHEAVGVVLQSGRPGTAAGTRLTWSIADSCGRCPACTRDSLPEKCHHLFKYGHAATTDGSGFNGCYATHILLRAGTHVTPVSKTLPGGLVAPVNCALATAVNVVEQVPEGTTSCLVQGAGMLGVYACALLHERGVQKVFCADTQAPRLERAEQFGAVPVDGAAAVPAPIQAACPHGLDAVVELAGDASMVPPGMAMLRPGGTYVFAGMVHPATRLDITGEQVIRGCLTLRGVHNYSPRHLDAAVAFLERTASRYPYEQLVSDPMPLAELPRAVDLAGIGTHLRVAVAPPQP